MKRFDGKTAWWLWALFIVYNMIPFAIVIFDTTFVWNAGTIVGFIVCYLVNIIWLPILIRDFVDVFDEYFVFYYGFRKITIKFEDVISISKTHNPIAATANSFDRLHIVTKSRNIYISLYKNDEFIEIVNSKIKEKV